MKTIRVAAILLVGSLPLSSPGGIPVIDYSNLIQNTTTALKQVAAYAEQVRQYQTQILNNLNTMNIMSTNPHIAFDPLLLPIFSLDSLKHCEV